MFRNTAWRGKASDLIRAHQDEALTTTIFLLKTFGPTGFLLGEEREAKKFKVCLGDPHKCTCPVFIREQEPCKHICWVLMRKFRLPREHEYSFQSGLVERQILEVLQGSHQSKDQRMDNDSTSAHQTENVTGSVCRRQVCAQDVCPICQEELLEKKYPVTYCRFGCGNNVHITCMNVWMEYQRLSCKKDMVKCPLCREDFSSLALLKVQVINSEKLFTAAEREKSDKHLGVLCYNCRVSPVTGKCFKCTVCKCLYLCEDCANMGFHPHHQLASRMKRRDKWRLSEDPARANSQPADDSIDSLETDPVPENALRRLPVMQVRLGSQLLDEGQQCRLCLQEFHVSQLYRTLSCHHKFHKMCVDTILQRSNFCPLDGYVIYSSFFPKATKSMPSKPPRNDLKDLRISGVSLLEKTLKDPPSHDCPTSEVPPPQRLTPGRTKGPCRATSDTLTGGGESKMTECQHSRSKQRTLFRPQSDRSLDKSTASAYQRSTPMIFDPAPPI